MPAEFDCPRFLAPAKGVKKFYLSERNVKFDVSPEASPRRARHSLPRGFPLVIGHFVLGHEESINIVDICAKPLYIYTIYTGVDMKSIRKLLLIGAVTLLMAQLSGCGETISGIGKDAQRIGQGVKTIFFKD